MRAIALAWTFDHVMELAGVVLAGIAAAAGIVAAGYSWVTNRDMTANWKSEITPAISWTPEFRDSNTAFMKIRIHNAGGAARAAFIAFADEHGVVANRYTVPAHCPDAVLHLPAVRVFNKMRGIHHRLDLLLHIARDASGNWWDAGRGVLLTEDVPDAREPDVFDKWCSDLWHDRLAILPDTDGPDLPPDPRG
jgi:hypothetical protein